MDVTPSFSLLCSDALDSLSAALSDHFDKLTDASKTNVFDPAAMEQHYLKAEGRRSECETSRKALNDIAVQTNKRFRNRFLCHVNIFFSDIVRMGLS